MSKLVEVHTESGEHFEFEQSDDGQMVWRMSKPADEGNRPVTRSSKGYMLDWPLFRLGKSVMVMDFAGPFRTRPVTLLIGALPS